MNSSSPKASFSLSGLLCNALGHDYIITRKVTIHINEYKCTQCGREVTDSFNGKRELLTYKTKKVNTALATFFEKKMKRVATQSPRMI